MEDNPYFRVDHTLREENMITNWLAKKGLMLMFAKPNIWSLPPPRDLF